MYRRIKSFLFVFFFLFTFKILWSSNIIKNSGFETGTSWWGIGTRHLGISLGKEFIDDKNSFGGSCSLKLPFRVPLSSKCYKLEKGEKYTLSFYGKSDTEGYFYLEITNFNHYFWDKKKKDFSRKKFSYKPGKWERFSISIIPNCELSSFYHININFISEKGNYWIDCVQLEKGEISDYKPENSIEAGISFKDRANIIVKGKDKPFADIIFYNYGKEKRKVETLCKVFDIFDRTVYQKDLVISSLPGKRVVKEIDLKTLPKGIFRIVVMSKEEECLDEKVFSILPEVKEIPNEKSFAGAYISFSPYAFEAMKKAGLKWTQTLSVASKFLRWNLVEPEKGRFIWHDEDIKLAGKYGFKIIGNLSTVRRFPKWVPFEKTEKGYKKPNIDDYKNYVRNVVQHYKNYIKYWTVADEADRAGFKPDEYAPYHKAAYEVIKEIDPSAKVIINSTGWFQDKVLQIIGPEYTDIISGNHIHVINYFKKNAEVARKYNKPLWATGVGWYARSMYKNYSDARPESGTKPRVAVKQFMTNIIKEKELGCKRFIYYDARYLGRVVYDLHQWSLFEFDGSLTSTAVGYASIINMLDGAELTGYKTTSRDKKISAYLFKTINGNYILAVINEEPLGWFKIYFPGEKKGFEFFDGFTNPLKVQTSKDGFTIIFNEQPFYIKGERENLVKLAKKIENVSLEYIKPEGKFSFENGPFSLVITDSDNFRLFFSGEEIIKRDYFGIGPLRENKGDIKTKVDPTGKKVTTLFKKGEVEGKRVIHLKNKSCVVEWYFENNEAKKQQGYMGLVFSKSIFENKKIDVEEVLKDKVKKYVLNIPPGGKAPVKEGEVEIEKERKFPAETIIYHLKVKDKKINLIFYPVETQNAKGRIGWFYEKRWYPRIGFQDGYFFINKEGSMHRKIELRKGEI